MVLGLVMWVFSGVHAGAVGLSVEPVRRWPFPADRAV